MKTTNLDSDSIQHLFDMRCEICKSELSSLQHAKLHYLDEHDISDGYIRCCEMKFRGRIFETMDMFTMSVY